MDEGTQAQENGGRQKEIKQLITEAAKARSVTAKFKPGRRASDLTQVRLKGQKEAVLSLPLKLLDKLPDEDLELMESEGDKNKYVLMFVVTKRLEQQDISTPERRAKLQNFLSKEME